MDSNNAYDVANSWKIHMNKKVWMDKPFIGVINTEHRYDVVLKSGEQLDNVGFGDVGLFGVGWNVYDKESEIVLRLLDDDFVEEVEKWRKVN